VETLPADHYSSRAFTDFIIANIDANRRDGRPFFAYLAYQAPHGPLAVPDDWRDKYKGRYDRGYDVIREERLGRLKKLGVVGENVVGFPRLPSIPAWDTLTAEQQQQSARKMELYAAMVEYMDYEIGRLIDHLKEAGEYDDTLIVFMSDNGAAGEDMEDLVHRLAPDARDWFARTFDSRPENWGRPRSCIEYGPAWAQVSSVPLRLFKGYQAEGGIRAPLIVTGPGVKHANGLNHSVLHVMDIAPTFLELAGVEHPANQRDSTVAPLQGRSLWPLLAGRQSTVRTDDDWLGWELFGNRAIRQGDWKLLYLLKGAGGTGDWQLFNLLVDPGETHDLSAAHPERRDAMLKLWDEYVRANGVIVSDDGPYAKPPP
jgi:arylsulfatase